MDFSDPPRPRAEASLLPMINVVFLLLIFFLIAARMTPPEPFAVTPPDATAETAAEAEGLFTLYLGPDGVPGYRDAVGEAALPALGAARDDHCAATDCEAVPPRLTLRADTAAPAAGLAALLPALGRLGFVDVELTVRPGPVSSGTVSP